MRLPACRLQLQQQLVATGRRALRGLDAGVLCGSALQERSDFLTMNCAGGWADTVGVSSVSGSMLDLSFAGAPPGAAARCRAQLRLPLRPQRWPCRARVQAGRCPACLARFPSPSAPSALLVRPRALAPPGGSISVDTAKNAQAYGDVKPSQVLDGAVEPPPEMQVRWRWRWCCRCGGWWLQLLSAGRGRGRAVRHAGIAAAAAACCRRPRCAMPS